MSEKARFPLLAKMLMWLLIHFAVLAGAFFLFVNWQLNLGLDSVLSGAAGDRLKTLGDAVASDLKAADQSEWDELLNRHVDPYGLNAMVLLSRGDQVIGDGRAIPEDIRGLIDEMPDTAGPGPRLGRGPDNGPPGAGEDRRPPRRDFRVPREGGEPNRRGGPGPEGPPGRMRDGPVPGRPGELRLKSREGESPVVRAIFLNRSSEDGAYWAALDLPLFTPGVDRPLHGMLLLRSENPSAGGLFFDLKPWVLGGLSVLFLSLLIWAPFIIGITRYVSRLSRATERIAQGKFDARIKEVRRDELGSLGNSIEEMAQRLDCLLSGQKRFLGDVAHELCSPLARIRTGLGVLEHGLDPSQRKRLDSIEEDVSELSELISEILAFTKASTAPNAVKPETIELLPLLEEACAHECPEHEVEWRVEPEVRVVADRRLLLRSVANVFRNAHRHAGPDCDLHVYTKTQGDSVELMIADNGPGVGPGVVSRLFEPFYRPDEARNREAGGAGLGMAIVHTAVEACGGSVSARRVDPHGLAIIMKLKAA